MTIMFEKLSEMLIEAHYGTPESTADLTIDLLQLICDREVQVIADAYNAKGVIFHPVQLHIWMNKRKEFPEAVIKKAIDKLTHYT